MERTCLTVTVGRWVLRCASQLEWDCLVVCCIQSALANGECASDKRTRGYTTAKRHDFEKHAKRHHQAREREVTCSLSCDSGDQLWQLIEMLNARYGRDTLVQFLRRIATMSENQTKCRDDDCVWDEFFHWVTGGDDY